MKQEEAIKELLVKCYEFVEKNPTEYGLELPVKDVKIAAKALEKQIEMSYGCHICNDTSNSRYYDNQKYGYCPHCGQRREIRSEE